MVRRAFRRAFDDDEVEDIYSNAWLGTLRALAQRHEKLSDEEIRKYVLAAVANHASKELRRRRRRPTTTLDAVHAVADDGLPPDERAAKLEHGRLTRDLLSTLPPRRRAVMLLRYGWGLEPAHVCRLVKGLSPRAYRKEITRGVDELTEKLRLVEKGEWCADREPVLKAYAAGLADPDQERQAQQHLSHCRHCTDFVAKLTGHLHDVGASVAVQTAAEAMHDGHFSLADRIGDAAHRVRDQAAGIFGGRGGGRRIRRCCAGRERARLRSWRRRGGHGSSRQARGNRDGGQAGDGLPGWGRGCDRLLGGRSAADGPARPW